MARRDEVLAAALDLLDEVGLDALTTRRLAAKLGIQAGSLYRHYPSKRALLDAMAEDLLRGVVAPGTADVDRAAGRDVGREDDWADTARGVAVRLRATMLSRRDGARLLTTFHGDREVGERVFWDLVHRLAATGVDDETANIAVDTLFGYVNGFTIEEQAAGHGPDDRRFGVGVEIVLDGIGRRVTERTGARTT